MPLNPYIINAGNMYMNKEGEGKKGQRLEVRESSCVWLADVVGVVYLN